MPPATDASLARASLVASLDAWKEGRSAETLRDRKPAIDFRDTQWEKGVRLIGYVMKAEESSGLSVRFTVQLQLQESNGTSRERAVVYVVDAGQAVVIRPEF